MYITSAAATSQQLRRIKSEEQSVDRKSAKEEEQKENKARHYEMEFMQEISNHVVLCTTTFQPNNKH